MNCLVRGQSIHIGEVGNEFIILTSGCLQIRVNKTLDGTHNTAVQTLYIIPLLSRWMDGSKSNSMIFDGYNILLVLFVL